MRGTSRFVCIRNEARSSQIEFSWPMGCEAFEIRSARCMCGEESIHRLNRCSTGGVNNARCAVCAVQYNVFADARRPRSGTFLMQEWADRRRESQQERETNLATDTSSLRERAKLSYHDLREGGFLARLTNQRSPISRLALPMTIKCFLGWSYILCATGGLNTIQCALTLLI